MQQPFLGFKFNLFILIGTVGSMNIIGILASLWDNHETRNVLIKHAGCERQIAKSFLQLHLAQGDVGRGGHKESPEAVGGHRGLWGLQQVAKGRKWVQ
jgi:hypothetical protein